MKSLVLNRALIGLLILALLPALVACGPQETAVKVLPSVSPTLQVTSVAPSASPSPAPTYDNPELARAVELGIGAYVEKGSSVSHEQFMKMLDAVVRLCNADLLSKWQGKLALARENKSPMTRAEGMMEVYAAAETLGEEYCAYNTDWDDLNARIGDPWAEFVVNRSLYPDIEKPTIVGPQWDHHDAAAYFYSMGRISLYSGATIFDFDSANNSMRPADPFLYEEALRAALRLYDSSLKVTERVPTQEDEAFLAKVDARRAAIRASKTEVAVQGKSYYVSNSGKDSNDGLSPETAWATLRKVNKTKLKAGDGVFFERGGLFRGQLVCQDGITYSAYGDGEKPRLYGSPESGADPKKWGLLEGTQNIWVYYQDMYDTGGLVFNNGESWAIRMTGFWDGSEYVDIVDKTTPIDIKSQLKNLEVFSAVDYTGYSSQEARYELLKRGKLYLRCDAGNPGKVYDSIEFLTQDDPNGNEFIVQGADGNVIDNLCVMYTSMGGIALKSNSTVQNCETGWTGGAIMNFGLDAQPGLLRVGDGIALGRGPKSGGVNNSVINCYAHHSYDQALTAEIGPGWTEKLRYVENVTFRGNLTEASSGGILLADWSALSDHWSGQKMFKHITVEDNYVVGSGYGWSHQTADYDWGIPGPVNNGNCSMFFAFPTEASEDIQVKNNVFYLAKYALVGGKVGDQTKSKRYNVTFAGNTYVQNQGGALAEWAVPNDDDYMKNFPYNQDARKTVAEVLGDQTAVFFGMN